MTQYTPRTEHEEHELNVWATGYDACMSWLWPRLQRAESDADYWYEIATKGQKGRRTSQLERIARGYEDAWNRGVL